MSIVTSINENDKVDVEQIIKSLKESTTDSEKFAGLIIIPKYLHVQNLSQKQLHSLFEAISVQFLKRLLKTDCLSENSSPIAYANVLNSDYMSLVDDLIYRANRVHNKKTIDDDEKSFIRDTLQFLTTIIQKYPISIQSIKLVVQLCYQRQTDRNEQRAILIDVYACLVEQYQTVTFIYQHNKQTFLLLVRLCIVEIRMIVENPSLPMILNNIQHLASCFLIIEQTIFALSQSDDDTITDDETTLIIQKLIEMFHGCIFLIDLIIDNDNEDENKQSYDTVLQATVRLLGIWLSQEPMALQSVVQSRLSKWLNYGLNSSTCNEIFKKFLVPIAREDNSENESSWNKPITI
ncbi:unnamed protein product [Didymodactylos carnosus]|uniref:Neurochondrin-like protein n=1 Tax=Didymodactylos carnosus TaxID=1234261 RepID=A0A813NPF7_9BILA|nr:unnamed protein product [Didymodactylos carnosus]CAF0758370.1 unnamed protein product [Didymodactylos carnosus]CAF3519505.1 unnamed protein product [Didymodactylos carnosus]CAF3537896.1 unnamed protein product [Didymodactylos carnosus]